MLWTEGAAPPRVGRKRVLVVTELGLCMALLSPGEGWCVSFENSY